MVYLFLRNPRGRLVYLDRVWRVADRVRFSAQTTAVPRALAAEPSVWRHGHDLARETGLKSGSLYPILVRLADRELVEARWEELQPAGRPRRHLYRLTPGGLVAASAAVAAAGGAMRSPVRGSRLRGLAGESS
jgi:PadR family transcriptional regulator, regulatory protein PadR